MRTGLHKKQQQQKKTLDPKIDTVKVKVPGKKFAPIKYFLIGNFCV